MFNTLYCYLQVQFGHAGACANQASETAVAKNQALRDAGAFVPKSFDELGDVIRWQIHHMVIMQNFPLNCSNTFPDN